MTPEQIARALEDCILDDLADDLANIGHTIRVGEHAFRIAYLEETQGVDDDAIVLIEEATGALYEVEIIGVQVRKIEPPKDEPVVDPNQLTLPGVAA